jgi:predicted DNA-binding transcriptional regulator YafY
MNNALASEPEKQKAQERLNGLHSKAPGTKEIKTRIMGFGSLAKVLEPGSLVNEIKDELRKALKFYGKW